MKFKWDITICIEADSREEASELLYFINQDIESKRGVDIDNVCPWSDELANEEPSK